MPINEADFRDLLVDLSSQAPLTTDRLGQVHGRIRHRRNRQRLLAVALSAVAVLALVATVAIPGLLRSGRTTAVNSSGLLPEYHYGGRLIAAVRLNTDSATSASVRFTPANWQLTIGTACAGSTAWPNGNDISLSVNGHDNSSESGCAGNGIDGVSAGPGVDEKFWNDQGVRLGHPSTLTISVRAGTPVATLYAGVYQRVPVDSYPFPAKPATLAQLVTPDSSPSLDSRSAGANGQWTLAVTPTAALELHADAIGPGSLRLTVGGVLIGLCESWDYTDQGCATIVDPTELRREGVDVVDGRPVDIAIQASGFGGDYWTIGSQSNWCAWVRGVLRRMGNSQLRDKDMRDRADADRVQHGPDPNRAAHEEADHQN
jgi:hypothetical protein